MNRSINLRHGLQDPAPSTVKRTLPESCSSARDSAEGINEQAIHPATQDNPVRMN